eukprot:1569560-Pleurochrysis_carterae.AAC.1
MTNSPSMRSATSWATTSACQWPSRPGHGEQGQGAQKIPRAARAIADAARLRSNKRVSPQPADGERTSQRQRQARPRAAAEAHRPGDLGDVVRAVLESVSLGASQPEGRGRPPLPNATPFSPAPALPLPQPGLPLSQRTAGKGKGRGAGGRGRGQGETTGHPFH